MNKIIYLRKNSLIAETFCSEIAYLYRNRPDCWISRLFKNGINQLDGYLLPSLIPNLNNFVFLKLLHARIATSIAT